jgi:PhnB protein
VTDIQPELWVDRAGAAVAFYAAAFGADEHGWRLGRIIDPFGHEWEIGRPVAGWPPPR